MKREPNWQVTFDENFAQGLFPFINGACLPKQVKAFITKTHLSLLDELEAELTNLSSGSGDWNDPKNDYDCALADVSEFLESKRKELE